MADWQTVLTTMVRNLIGDTSTTSPTYSDARVQEAIVVSGLIAAQEFDFDTDYIFDLETPDISPDPVINNDTIAMALFTLKAACILNQNSYTNAIGAGIRVRDGDSEVDTTGSFKGYRDILELGPCAAYQKLLKYRSFKDSMQRGKAVMSPLSHESLLVSGTYSLSTFFDSLLIR